MDAQSYTAQERRAANQVWAAAGAYGFEPLFLARYTDGTTDFYMNTVVGLIHKYYGDALIRSIFDAWDSDLRQTMLDDMTWLYLENAAYRLELPRRPVLEALRPRIPSPAFTYYGKQVWEQALAALLCGENLLLAGGKATGKNVLAENLAAAFGRPAWDISFHVNMDAASLIGMDTFADGQVVFRPGPVYRCAQCGGFGVLDEINMAKNEALAVLHAVLDFRRCPGKAADGAVRRRDQPGVCRQRGCADQGAAQRVGSI